MDLQKLILNSKFSDVVSVFALVISCVSILWNIYRDIILKAKLRVSIQSSKVVRSGKKLGTFITVTGTNHGPGAIFCDSFVLRLPAKSLWHRLIGKNLWGTVIPDYNNQFCDKLPKKLEVGETINLFFPYENKMFLADKPLRVGIKDSFGRINWATSQSLKETTSCYLRDFPSN